MWGTIEAMHYDLDMREDSFVYTEEQKMFTDKRRSLTAQTGLLFHSLRNVYK